MASTRAEALARYARASRVTDVTRLPVDPDAAERSGGDTFLHDMGAVGGLALAGLRRLVRNAPRAAVLLMGTVAMTPVLPALFG